MFAPLVLTWFLVIFLYFFFDVLLYVSVLNINRKPLNSNSHLPLSVIIAAKNEAENLKRNLPYVLNQNYPQFEVIVVNDQSQDQSLKILKAFEQEYPSLKILNVKTSETSSKKKALDLGIQEARYEHLVFTDADCKPQSGRWLTHIRNYFSPKHQLVLGFSPYQKRSGFINKIIRFETLVTAINYYGFAKLGLPYMGVGRNLAYTKTLYQNLDGFATHQHLLSGDDDLLVGQAAKTQNIALCLDPESFVESQPKTDLASWVKQKRRHISTASHYSLRPKLGLSLQYLSKVLFWILALPLSVFLEFQNGFQFQFISTVLLLLGIKSVLNFKLFKLFSSQDLWLWTYFWELNLICLQFYIFTKNLFSTKSTW